MDEAPTFIANGGEMAERIRARDWSQTPLGPIAGWPQPLRSIVQVCLESVSPIAIYWGRELIVLYNDVWGTLIGDKHPSALGQPARVVFAEIWDTVGPMFDKVITTGEACCARNQLLRMNRDGWPKESYFTFSLNPIRDGDGNVCGVFNIAAETTARVRAERALYESEERFRVLVEAMAQAVWEADAAGEAIEDSGTWRAFTGQTAAELLGLGWVNAVHPEDRVEAKKNWQRAVREGRSLDTEFRLRSASGGWRWTNTRAAPLRNPDGSIRKWVGMNIDIGERKAVEERQRLLLAELDHRVKNTLALVQSIAAQTLHSAETLEHFSEAFEGRIAALARGHDLLTRSQWQTASLHEVVALTLGAYGTEQVRLAGPNIALSPDAAISIHLAFHELTTNAAKYGALAVDGGFLELQWALVGEPQAAVCIDWSEHGGPPVKEPVVRGFGMELIEQSFALEFDAEVVLDFQSGGVRCHLELPLSSRIYPL
ncbi:HWE histidine kinase domain-containing protein [Aquisalimonas sp.]|uniref:PAS domain-containing sensor histidine kinase n=1 Tax=Aquisalimonas sp. TaxID=1872621 RepID=UPI0025B878D1|nr:HWE histidine kinase domain-containing protein [Aquisalimonas sp.]